MDPDREALIGQPPDIPLQKERCVLQVIYSASTDAHNMTVYDTDELYGERGRFRVLEFADGAVQGAMDLNDPARILLEYPRAIIHLLEANNPAFQDAFLIGHGIGTIAGRFADRRFKTAELDESVAALSRRYFGCSQELICIGDGRELLATEPDERYDYVIVDAFTDRGVPRQLCSQSFFRLAAAKLGGSGAIIMNLFGRGKHDPLACAIHATLGTVFDCTRAFALPGHGAADMQNMILIGSSRTIAYQARRMAGFAEVDLQPGYVVHDE